MKVSELNKFTGEVIEFNPKNEAELVDNYRQVSETIKTLELAKKQLAKQAEQYISDRGTSEPINGYMFRQSSVQRMTYDKAVLRSVIQDEDTFDQLLVVDKTSVDAYLKEHLDELGDDSTVLRKSMLPVGKPYSVTKLEKVG